MGDRLFRFAGFELDPPRAELRGPEGAAIKLRPKTFDMLRLFAANPGRVLGKRELLEAIWPNVNVGDDSLFQCIRELRTALGDDPRQMIKSVSSRGYMFAVEVSSFSAGVVTFSAGETGGAPTITVMPFRETGTDGRGAALAAGAADRLLDGLANIDTLRVVAPRSRTTTALPDPASWPNADFVVQGELQRDERSWVLHARTIKTDTGEVQSVATVSTDVDETDTQLQQARLAAGIGHPLALRLNALREAGQDHRGNGSSATKVVIEQALAANNQTTRERFTMAQTMLETAIAGEPDNLDLQVALATLQSRGIQMVWYGPSERGSIENNIASLLERALRAAPNYIPVLDAHCRFLNTTTRFVENLVACAKTLRFDPWNGLALYHLGLAQLHLGRFEDALATFEQAYRFDTPSVSRWTWTLGAGWASMMLGRTEEAIPWLQRSLAVTAASGRTHMLLGAAYQQLGRMGEAQIAMATGLELRPGSTLRNVPTPRSNTSPVFVEASDRIMRFMVAAGLPAG
jgi:DNA-binding winged helix-turn-helix (wHTH) protein/tetratricopeptide (TPR) repeat protein